MQKDDLAGNGEDVDGPEGVAGVVFDASRQPKDKVRKVLPQQTKVRIHHHRTG